MLYCGGIRYVKVTHSHRSLHHCVFLGLGIIWPEADGRQGLHYMVFPAWTKGNKFSSKHERAWIFGWLDLAQGLQTALSVKINDLFATT